jgi:hypothetical protein
MNSGSSGPQCNDHSVSFCCPKYGAGDLHCNKKGYKWTSWIDNDDPDENQLSTGDWETHTAYAEREVCSNPIGKSIQFTCCDH